MTDYKDYRVAAAPPWQQTPNWINWHTAFGLLHDEFLEAAKRAIKARFPQYAPGDALDLIGNTFQIDRAFAKNDAQFIAQLMNAWTSWRQAGTVVGMTNILTTAGLVGVQIKESWYWSDGNPTYWFSVIANTPVPWNVDPLADGTWGDPGTWGDGGVWNGGIPVADRQRLRALIWKWKPTHAVCAAVIFPLSGIVWGLGGHTWGDGSTWGGGKVLYINMTV